jgi:glyoxylase-like metal-dependent hydrolase (beta-lactamase superfamily II)
MDCKSVRTGAQTLRKLGTGVILLALLQGIALGQTASSEPGAAGSPYPNMPQIASPGIQIGKYLSVPASSLGPAIEPAKGYRTQDLGSGLYLVTDNMYQSMFMVYEDGVVVIDAPPSFSSHIPQAIAEVTNRPITNLVYSHSHSDHIGGASKLRGNAVIIGQEETKTLLQQANDSRRPVPTLTFKDRYTLKVGSQVLELSYDGYGHAPGNIYIYAPAQKVLMVVDVISPGWIPYRNLSLSRNIPGLFRQVDEIASMPFETLVGGHVTRTGNRADVLIQAEFMRDLKTASTRALGDTTFGATSDPRDQSNPWALADSYVDRVTLKCVNTMTPKWATRLAGFDAYIWEHCYSMVESLRAD